MKFNYHKPTFRLHPMQYVSKSLRDVACTCGVDVAGAIRFFRALKDTDLFQALGINEGGPQYQTLEKTGKAELVKKFDPARYCPDEQ